VNRYLNPSPTPPRSGEGLEYLSPRFGEGLGGVLVTVPK
jgi:hypothetical protein